MIAGLGNITAGEIRLGEGAVKELRCITDMRKILNNHLGAERRVRILLITPHA